METNFLKFKLFNFLGAPVRLSLLFFLFLPMVGFDIATFISVFIAVLIHEMAHAYVADRKGYSFNGIDIDLFFGSASIDMNMHQRDSMWVALAGPISNLVLIIISIFLIPVFPPITTFASVNLVLFIFNILPIYPLDGGRAFRDFLMLNMRNRKRASEIASITSLTLCVFGFIYSLLSGSFIMAIFFGLFFYQTCKNEGYIK